jgi:SAM-dependent methyltransferase
MYLVFSNKRNKLFVDIKMEILKKCNCCNSTDIVEAFNVPDRHYGIKGLFKIFICKACGLYFLNPMPNDLELSEYYPKSYYSYQNFFVQNNRFKEFLKKIFFFNIKTQDPIFEQPGKMLDIGCGSGQFIYKMREKGWDVYGVEVNVDGAIAGQKIAGLNIFPGNLLDAKFEDNSFDYIRSNHSFEHIYNPNETLTEIHRILKPDGKLMIGVPNIDSLNARTFKEFWYYLGAPVHTYNYSPKTLSLMLEKNGFVVEKITYSADYSGILGSIQIYFNRNSERTTNEGFFINFSPFVVLSHWIAKFTNVLRTGDAMEITAKIK